MIFRVQMKDPDSLYDGIVEALEEDPKFLELDEDEQEAVKDIRIEKAQGVANKWFKYDEYLTVEIDTDKNTCIVVENES